MRIDLHVHSDRSDGAYPPAEVARLAHEAGCSVFALTDHDTTAGVTEARAAGEALGVEVLLGAEISSVQSGVGVHVLGYLFDPEEPALARELALVRDDRVWRAEQMVARLRELGVDVTFERVREIAKGESVGRPHVAQAMVEAGVVASTPDAFTPEWIGNGGRAYVEKHAPTPAEAVRLITAAGGAAVLAHPIWLSRDGLDDEALIESLVAAGLAGIEVRHPEHDEGARARFRRIARRHGLVMTGSSDFHGNKHGGSIACEETTADALAELRARTSARS